MDFASSVFFFASSITCSSDCFLVRGRKASEREGRGGVWREGEEGGESRRPGEVRGTRGGGEQRRSRIQEEYQPFPPPGSAA
eukprot:749656-Hanusia_phi.AAC.1